MKITYLDNCSILELEESSKLGSLTAFLEKNKSICPHVIIDIMNFSADNSKIIKTLLPFRLNWEKRNKSFILVSLIEKESLKDLVSLSSRAEAVDFFHMEELTRTI